MDKRWDETVLIKITGKRRATAQQKWFKEKLGVDVPFDAKGVLMNDSTYDALLKQRCGLTQQSQASKTKPRLRPA